MQVAARGIARRLHDKVDVWDEGGWWEGTVTHVTKLKVKVQPTVSQNIITARLQDVRTGLVWNDHTWQAKTAGKCF